MTGTYSKKNVVVEMGSKSVTPTEFKAVGIFEKDVPLVFSSLTSSGTLGLNQNTLGVLLVFSIVPQDWCKETS